MANEVWVLLEDNYEPNFVIGVYSFEEKAQEAAKMYYHTENHSEYEIIRVVIDAFPLLEQYTVSYRV